MTYTGPDGGANADPTQYWNLLAKPAAFTYNVKVKPDKESGTVATLRGKIAVSIQIRNKYDMGTAAVDALTLTRENAESNKWFFSAKELKRVTRLVGKAKARTLKVFILAGQSNMVGHGKVEFGRNPDYDKNVKGSPREIKGGIGGLRNLSSDPATSKMYRHLLDENDNWIQRDDVMIYSTAPGKEKGRLSVGFGKGNWFGPELGFGTVIGNHFDEPVLIIKTAWGGKDLAVDFRSPTSGETKLAKDREVGAFYRQMMTLVRDHLKNFESDFPELKGCKAEIVGFGWHQGWNDGCSKEMTAEYEQNMANFINDVRTELGVADLPFVIANTGQNGAGTKGTFADLCLAQMNIGDVKKHPEFRGTVTAIDTRPFKATEARSPSGFGYHWNHSGETHYKIGQSMGQEMIKLIKQQSKNQ